jgi:hypothetical protein
VEKGLHALVEEGVVAGYELFYGGAVQHYALAWGEGGVLHFGRGNNYE